MSKQELINEKIALEHQILMDEIQMEQELMTNTESSGPKEAPNLKGNDRAGVLARNDYGINPQAQG